MPPSVLLGRVVAPGAPLWTQVDTDLAVALAEIDADRCPGCGHQRTESMDPDHEYAFAADPLRCHACATRERTAKGNVDAGGWDDAGIQWIVTRR